MRLLVLYPYVPWPLDRGTHHRTFHLLKELARVHDVSLVALAENGSGAEHAHLFQKFCACVEIIPFTHPPWAKLFPGRLLNFLPSNVAHWTVPHVAQRLARILSDHAFDAIHVCDIVMAQYFLQHDAPLVIDRSRVDLQFQTAEHSRMNFPLRDRLLRYEGYAKLWLYERRLARRASFEVVCGPDDAAFLRRWVRRDLPVEVLVNGVDVDYFAPTAKSERADLPTLMFCGAMDYNPNIDALRWYFAEIHDALRRHVPALEFFIVGKNPTSAVLEYARHPGVTVTGGVPDVRPFYRRAWLQVVPLRIGGGTRLKIVESLSIGTPVVSTAIGAQGLGLRHDHEILLADTPAEFVHQTTRALADAALRGQLAKAGMVAARDRFAWTSIGERLRQIYASRFASLAGQFAARKIGGDENPAAVRPPGLGLDPFGAGRR